MLELLSLAMLTSVLGGMTAVECEGWKFHRGAGGLIGR